LPTVDVPTTHGGKPLLPDPDPVLAVDALLVADPLDVEVDAEEGLEVAVLLDALLRLDVDTLLEVDVLLEKVPPSGTSEPGDEHAVSAR
jgi:hypothetical protein